MLKRRQHHVWQRYLKAWSANERVFCLQDGQIFSVKTSNVAVERDFYKLHSLSENELALIRKLVIDASPEEGRDTHEQLLDLLFTPLFAMEKIKKARPHDKRIDRMIESHKVNALEDYHASIEKRFLPLLERLLSGDISFYADDEECINFLYYLATQHMRTRKVKQTTIEMVHEKIGIDLTSVWNVMIHMFANNIGGSLYVERHRRKLDLVRNTTGVEFVTGDQPVINLNSEKAQEPTRLALYYPVSSSLALVLAEVDENPCISTDTLDAEQVKDLNTRMHSASHSQVFGFSEAPLLLLLQQVRAK